MLETDNNKADLSGCKLILGVSGGIAAYKTADLTRRFKKAGAAVQILMTPSAERFISPLTLGTLSEREVLTEVFPANETGSWTKHVSLGLWADLFVIAPATAQTLAKLAHGFSDSMLTATALSARCPLLICPSMDRDMYAHPATQANMEAIASLGYEVMDPAYGELASGLEGEGRLPEPAEIFERVLQKLGEENLEQPAQVLAGKHVLVTAGPTREHVDPVRFLSNPSTGTMGYALAEAAARRGARVTLVSGPTTLDTPPGSIERVDVTTARQMHEAVQAHAGDADLVFMAAAVADYTPAEPSDRKLKKQEGDLTLRMRRTPDILAELGKQKREGQVLVGFALETNDALANARQKLESKNLDWIALNKAGEKGAGFGPDTNRITLLHRSGREEAFNRMSKRATAEALLNRVTADAHG